MTRRMLVYVLLLLLVMPIIYVTWKKTTSRSLCRNLACISMHGKNVFGEKELYADNPDVFRALFQSGNRLLRIEATHVPSISANQELNASIIKMKALFEKAPAPYPGDVSDAVICDPEYFPTYEASRTDMGQYAYFTGYLNNRMTFGSCSKDQAVYKGIMAITYCPAQNLLLKAELIEPILDFETHAGELQNQIRTLTCAE